MSRWPTNPDRAPLISTTRWTSAGTRSTSIKRARETSGPAPARSPFRFPWVRWSRFAPKTSSPPTRTLGTTHITNGCYRLHPVEWNIGEAAGLLASFVLARGELPRTVHSDRDLRRSFQRQVLSDGVPLAWLVDVPVWSRDFAAVQRLVMAGGYGDSEDVLEFDPDGPIDAREREEWAARIPKATDPCGPGPVSRAEFASAMVEAGYV